MNFNEMPLIAPILKATLEAGYTEPTPIQRETIPLVLSGRDVLGCAQTGTGKTAAFALPILQKLFEDGPKRVRLPRVLVVTPTRELAIQIQENFALYGKYLPLTSCVIFGGVSQVGQVAQLRRDPQIIVATPGRLNDLIGQGYISLSQIEVFVLDEADRMLDMGFIVDVKRIISQLPQKRQTLFFSATMPAEVEALAMNILHDPASVKVDPVSSTVDAIRQSLYLVDRGNKKFLLADLLRKPEVENALVFTRTKHGADKVVEELERMGVPAMAIHGNKSQNARQAAMGQFKDGRLRVLIATDIAARGIDVVGLSHVINYDQPDEPEAYIHRIGRTGRAGLGGDAISFCCIDEMKQLAAVEKLIGIKIPRKESAWPMQVFTESVKQPRMPRPARVRDVNLRGEAVTARPPEHRAHRDTPVQGRRGIPIQSSRGTPVQGSRTPLSSRTPQSAGSRVTPAQGTQNSHSSPAQGSDSRNTPPVQGSGNRMAPLRGTRLHAEPLARSSATPGTRQQQPTAQSRMDAPRFGPRPQTAANRAPETEHEYAQPRQTAQPSQQAPQAEQRKKRIKFESR